MWAFHFHICLHVICWTTLSKLQPVYLPRAAEAGGLECWTQIKSSTSLFTSAEDLQQFRQKAPDLRTRKLFQNKSSVSLETLLCSQVSLTHTSRFLCIIIIIVLLFLSICYCRLMCVSVYVCVCVWGSSLLSFYLFILFWIHYVGTLSHFASL